MPNSPKAKYLKDYTSPTHQLKNLQLEFSLEPLSTSVVSRASYQSNSSDIHTLELYGESLVLKSIKVNGNEYTDFIKTDESLVLHNLPLKFELEIHTKISPETNSSLEGLYLSDGAYCTQCEAEGFRKITYFLDRPDVLTDYEVTIIADRSIPFLLSNGNKIEEGVLPNNKHYTKWYDPHNKPSYLFALVAGDFDVLNDHFITCSGKQVDLALFVDKGNLPKAHHAMSSLKLAMKWDEERFGLEYDLDIYMIVAVDFFNMGAMENKGLNVFNSACVLANQNTATDRDYHTIESIVGHEYFHNWTGNRVTCRDWFQLSLKEGLTVFRDQEFSSDLGSRALNRIDAVNAMKLHQFAEDDGPMAHPIRPNKVIEMNNFYTVTVYNKGAEVIRMMHTLLGEVAFQKGMKLYFSRHDGQAVTCDDFVNAMADASGYDLNQFKHWYEQFGTPTITVKTFYDDKARTYQVTITQQHAKNDPVKNPLHIPFAIELIDTQGKTIPLVINGQKQSNILNVNTFEQMFLFEKISSSPTPVFLDNFSAPCKLNYQYTLDELTHILEYSTSEYSKWEAIQTIYKIQALKAVKSYGSVTKALLPEQVFVTLEKLIVEFNGDKALLAELLTLPTFDTLATEFDVVPVDALHTTLLSFEEQLANRLKKQLKHAYQNCSEIQQMQQWAISERALKNTCLYYLSKNSDDETNSWLQAQFSSANMTLKLGALKAVVNAQHVFASEYLQQFDQQWRHDLLVMDKWFAISAMNSSDSVIDDIKALYSHPCFDKSNPNRVRSLIGSFVRGNTAQFHRNDGAGYELLGDLLIELNDINPQNASRMITPFMSWKKLDNERQQSIKQQLLRLSSLKNLSADLYEKVNNALK